MSKKAPPKSLNQAEVDRESSFKIYAAVSFAVLMIALGVPLWWKTTQVYRASLPSSEIYDLSEKPISIPLKIEIQTLDSTNHLAKGLIESLRKTLTSFEVHPRLELRMAFETRMLRAHWSDPDAVQSEASDFCFVLDKGSSSPYLGRHCIFVPAESPEIALETVKTLLLEVCLGTGQLLSVVRRNLKERQIPNDAQSRQQDVWSVSIQPEHSVELYLVNPEPESCDTRGLSLRDTVAGPLDQWVKTFEHVTRVTVKTETLYGVRLPTTPVFDKEKQAAFIHEDALPLIVNPLEPHITTVEPGTPVYRLLLYISPSYHNPLYIQDASGAYSTQNSFTIAGWGGVTIFNPPNRCNQSITTLPTQLINTQIAQLRQLLGISSELPADWSKTSYPMSDWELSRLELRTLVDNTFTSINTLGSLEQLLSDILNIVISDQVAQDIHASVEALELVVESLKNAKLDEALEASRRALVHSEKAFFDPSLLALLYFPDDQKYAIYIPLFLPVGVPVVMSLRRVIAFYKSRK